MGTRLRRLLSAGTLAATALIVSPVVSPGTPAARAAEPEREPVILVHGWNDTAARMATLRGTFAAAGHPAYVVDLPGSENVENARAVAALVRQVRAETGAAKVHLVAHSMGGLSTRYYLKFLGGTAEVRSYVSLGTSHYGYSPACLLPESRGGQMCPTSRFLDELNAGDDTPGAVAYTTLRSTKDTPGITRLDGGACFHEIPGVRHSDEPTSPQFIQAALDAVGGTCPGTVVDLPVTGR